MLNNSMVYLYHDANLFNDLAEKIEYIASLEFKDIRSNIDMLESMFKLSQTIDKPWIDNSNFYLSPIVATRGTCRSTSIGDRILIVDSDDKSSWYSVDNFGFGLLKNFEF